MLEALPWVISTAAVLAALVMLCLSGAKRRPAGSGPWVKLARGRAAQTRQAVRAATRGKLAELSAALDSDRPEEELAELANEAQEGRQ